MDINKLDKATLEAIRKPTEEMILRGYSIKPVIGSGEYMRSEAIFTHAIDCILEKMK